MSIGSTRPVGSPRVAASPRVATVLRALRPGSGRRPRPSASSVAGALAVGLAISGILGCTPGGGGAGSGDDPGASTLRVFAAASLSEVLRDLGGAFEQRLAEEGKAVRLEVNLAGSNTLARQIRATEGPDVFLSADREWVDVVEAAGRAVPSTRRDLFSNRLVIVARRDSPLTIDGVEDLATEPFRHLSLADPAAVPAGRYARAYLEAEGGGLWQAVDERVVPALDVRAALGLVATDPEIVGIVYRTDLTPAEDTAAHSNSTHASSTGASSENEVRILAEIPLRDELPIVYCGVLLDGGEQADLGRRFLDFVASPEAGSIVEHHGFVALGPVAVDVAVGSETITEPAGLAHVAAGSP